MPKRSQGYVSKGVSKVDKAVPDRVDNRYEVIITYPGSTKQYSKVIRGKRAAEAHYAEMYPKIRGGALAAPSGAETLQDLMEAVHATKKLRVNSERTYRRVLDDHVYPLMGGERVRDLANRWLVLKGHFTTIEREAGGHTRERAELLVNEALRIAVKQGQLLRNPMEGEKRTRGTSKPKYRPTVLEQARIRQNVLETRNGVAAGTELMMVALLDVLMACGVRISEAIGLSPDDIDSDTGAITIRRQAYYTPGHGYLYGPAKTVAGDERTIKVPKFVIKALATTKLRNGTRRIELPWEDKDGAKQAHDLYFWSTGKQGEIQPMSRNTVCQRMNRIGARLKIAGPLTPHGYRHRYATLLHDRGIPEKTRQYLLGHASVGVTMAVYTEASQAEIDRAAQVVETAWKEAQAALTGQHDAPEQRRASD